MYLLLGNSYLELGNFICAIQSFERAQTQMRPHTSRALLVVSLVRLPAVISRRVEIIYDP